MEPETIGLIVTAVVAACSAISAIAPSTNKLMKLIDLVAFNWGKARNDQQVQ